MREIKFRAWDKWKNKMISPHNGDFIKWHAMSNWKDCLEVMQFTGLKDMHEIEIYEGDIIYLAGYGNYIAEFPFLELYDALPNGDIEGIKGNIHENPELLDTPQSR